MTNTGDRGLMTNALPVKEGPPRQANGKFGCRPGAVQESVPLRLRILGLLKEDGPMSAREIAKILKLKHINTVAAALKKGDYHIAAWRRDSDGGRLYPRALYAYGPGHNVKKPPKLTRADYNNRFRSKLRVASVWDLGIPKRERHAVPNVRNMDVRAGNQGRNQEA